ncbi:hypothetical protein PD280_21555 [Virgibacillus salarius]|uniref:hypothetical protein n=1 Tax=Virgibacillus salarius TaxID=447199 RepID=UPI002493985A|nr:hypothetical protein [Virgibacillus salarius]WBX80152.1 hypothetical protein PD280_21555 [Virgibacillus salarius]
MDRKTLEYMEKRSKEARKIVDTIEKLKSNIEETNSIGRVTFYDSYGNYLFDSSTGSLANEMKKAYERVVEKEIELLEQTLLEL